MKPRPAFHLRSLKRTEGPSEQLATNHSQYLARSQELTNCLGLCADTFSTLDQAGHDRSAVRWIGKEFHHCDSPATEAVGTKSSGRCVTGQVPKGKPTH
jgi:hypothetical protein